MTERSPEDSAVFTIRLADVGDVPAIDWLDTFGTSPHRNINRGVANYFGSVDPSTHERNVIFLASLPPDQPTDLPFCVAGKAELLLAPEDEPHSDIGYIKRVVVHPDWRGQGVARALMEHISRVAPTDFHVRNLDLHVWEGNAPAIRLYESLGFTVRHRELYMRLMLDDTTSG
jgi:ribosomal protein S18 acetylase RimI-like enzyme